MLENFAGLLAIMATSYGVVMACANFPQAMKIIKMKSSSNVSILTYFILVIGVLIWITYGISINNFPIVSTNSLSLVSLTSVIVVYYKYKK